MDALQLGSVESIHRVYVRRIKAEEVFIEKDDKDNFIFPLVTGEFQQPYGNATSFARFTKKFMSAEDPDDFNATDLAGEDEEDACTAEAAADDFTMEDKGDSEDVLDRDPFDISFRFLEWVSVKNIF